MLEGYLVIGSLEMADADSVFTPEAEEVREGTEPAELRSSPVDAEVYSHQLIEWCESRSPSKPLMLRVEKSNRVRQGEGPIGAARARTRVNRQHQRAPHQGRSIRCRLVGNPPQAFRGGTNGEGGGVTANRHRPWFQ